MKPADTKYDPHRLPGLKHPGRWIWLVLAVPVVLGLSRLKFDVEIFGLLPGDIPAVQGLTLYQEHFANARELVVTLKGTDAERLETLARNLAGRLRAEPRLVSSVTWEPPWLEHPEQAAELIAYLWLNQPPEAFRECAGRLAAEKLPALLAAARDELSSSLSPQQIARLSYDPFGLTQLPEAAAGSAPTFAQGQEAFCSADGTFRILFVEAAHDLKTYRDCAEWLEQIETVVHQSISSQEASDRPVIAGYTGRPAFVSEVALGMERDMKLSIGGTAAIIAALFWLFHRRIKPMLWLLVLLAAILGSTLALGGLLYGTINVISMGFAAILLGLAVDYGVVHYQEALTHPTLSVPQIRRAIAPSILWAAVTTVAAFLALNLGGLPGLGQLGTMVGLGVTLAATIMIFEFLPPLFPGRNESPAEACQAAPKDPEGERACSATSRADPLTARHPRAVLAVTATIVLCTMIVIGTGLPGLDTTGNALRPRDSAAFGALSEIQKQLGQEHEPLSLIVAGASIPEVAKRLADVQTALDHAVTNGLGVKSTMPTALWPRVEFQMENRAVAQRLASNADLFRQAARTNGFTEAALGLTERILETWQLAGTLEGVYWPTNPMSRWIFDKCTVRSAAGYFALGLVNVPADDSSKASLPREVESTLPKEGVWLSGWQLLGGAVFSRVQSNLWKVIVPMVVLVLLSLHLAFRRTLEVLLSLAVLLLSGLCLLAVMRLAGWSWNLLNLMAIPLILGTGVDYSIFMQLALRRHNGDLRVAHRSVGRALLLCGGTAIAGFGSLAVSSNAGMASLGQVCAVGIAANMVIGIFLLPTWWKRLQPHTGASTVHTSRQTAPNLAAPSSLYRSELWRLGLWLARILPRQACEGLGKIVATVYWALAGHRRRVVVENLLPVLNRDRAKAKRAARALFRNFALKVVDLWRYEAGLPIDHLFGRTHGWEHFESALAKKRGILLLTPHLGNWEFGGPLLTRRGVPLHVVTMAEPGQEFTELRQASRARWQIETLVIGDNPLAFLEIIRRLEDGAAVAVLLDRPPPPTAVTVELFGQPFDASLAAAELARASGCLLLPVYLVRTGNAYDAHVLPAIDYERPTLRDRTARRNLTQKIMRTFEPLILAHPEQWYHFVPIWPKTKE